MVQRGGWRGLIAVRAYRSGQPVRPCRRFSKSTRSGSAAEVARNVERQELLRACSAGELTAVALVPFDEAVVVESEVVEVLGSVVVERSVVLVVDADSSGSSPPQPAPTRSSTATASAAERDRVVRGFENQGRGRFTDGASS